MFEKSWLFALPLCLDDLSQRDELEFQETVRTILRM
jgi:hypothetical protein